jgi:hypothetical protein
MSFSPRSSGNHPIAEPLTRFCKRSPARRIDQAAILGLLGGEVLCLSKAIAQRILHFGVSSFARASFISLDYPVIDIVVYLADRRDWLTITRLALSKRLDHFGALIIGFLASLFVGGIGTSKYQREYYDENENADQGGIAAAK